MKKRMYTIKKILSPELQEVHAFLVSMRYTLKALKELYPLEVKFIRDRCKELHLKGFDELIEKLELGIKYDANGERILLNEDEKELKIKNYYVNPGMIKGFERDSKKPLIKIRFTNFTYSLDLTKGD